MIPIRCVYTRNLKYIIECLYLWIILINSQGKTSIRKNFRWPEIFSGQPEIFYGWPEFFSGYREFTIFQKIQFPVYLRVNFFFFSIKWYKKAINWSKWHNYIIFCNLIHEYILYYLILRMGFWIILFKIIL